MWPTRPGARRAAYSSAHTTWPVSDSRRLPHPSACQPCPIQPPRPSSRSHSRRASMPSCSLPGPPRPRTPAYGPTRCSASHARARPRSSSSSAPKLNSTPLPLWSGPVRVYALGRSLAAAALAMASSCASIGIGSVPTVPGRKSAIFSGVQAPSA